MSSSITPTGPAGTPNVTTNSPDTTPTPATTDAKPANATDATVTEGMKMQQDGVDKAMQNVPPRTTAPSTDDVTTVEMPAVVMSPTDLAAKQMKSAAQSYPEASQEAADDTPSGVRDMAVTKEQVLAGSAVPDVMTEATGDLLSATDTLAKLLEPIFQFDFGAFFAQQFFIRQMFSSQAYRNNSQRTKEHTEDKAEVEVVRKWVELMMIGGKLTEVITEQFKTTIQTITQVTEKKTIAHKFTPGEISDFLGAMQGKGMLPREIPNRDEITRNIADAANQTLDRLNRG